MILEKQSIEKKFSRSKSHEREDQSNRSDNESIGSEDWDKSSVSKIYHSSSSSDEYEFAAKQPKPGTFWPSNLS